jgi:hypothetical protein
MRQSEIVVPEFVHEDILQVAILDGETKAWYIKMGKPPELVWSLWLPPSFPFAPAAGMRCKFFLKDGPWPFFAVTAVELDGVYVELSW